MRQFERALEELNDQLMQMGALVASSVHRCAIALTQKSDDSAHQVLRDEARIDQLEIQIDESATRLIALEQPVARDMRFVVAAIKINTDLERMGDLAVNIVERALTLKHQRVLESHSEFPQLSSLVESMVLGSLDAFVKRDASAAREILSSDDAVDKLRNTISEELIGLMKIDPENIEPALDLIIVARSFERIADHATNIAEDVIFLANGVDVRHQVVAAE